MCGRDLHHSTVGIVGFGRIGSAVAHRLHHGFSCNILYYSPQQSPRAAATNAEHVSLDHLLKKVFGHGKFVLVDKRSCSYRIWPVCKQSDFVVVTCRLTPETKEMFGSAEFSKVWLRRN